MVLEKGKGPALTLHPYLAYGPTPNAQRKCVKGVGRALEERKRIYYAPQKAIAGRKVNWPKE